MVFLGIDPGFTGALCALHEDGRILALVDTPTMRVGEKREYDLAQMARTLASFRSGRFLNPAEFRVALELTVPMPRQGVVSMWLMGFGVGVWEGLLAALSIPMERVRPQRWQGVMLDGLPRGKDAARYRAQSLWPDHAEQFSLKKHHGRADAALIAEWGRRTWRAGSSA